jgi:molybdate transport system ATP-binding protein
VFVSHNRDEVYHLCDRVCLIDNGKSEGVSDLRTLMEQPGTLSAALLAAAKIFPAPNACATDWFLHRIGARSWIAAGIFPRISAISHSCASYRALRRRRAKRRPLPRVARYRGYASRYRAAPAISGGGGDFSRIRMELSKEKAAGLKKDDGLTIRMDAADILLLK